MSERDGERQRGSNEALLAIVICFIMKKKISRIGEKKASWCWLNCDVIKKI